MYKVSPQGEESEAEEESERERGEERGGERELVIL